MPGAFLQNFFTFELKHNLRGQVSKERTGKGRFTLVIIWGVRIYFENLIFTPTASCNDASR